MRPRGAFYMIVKMAGVDDSDDFARWLLEEHRPGGETVLVAPAGGFYATPGAGADEVRMAYVLEAPKLERAMEVFRAGLERYRTVRHAAAHVR
jgi:aspartate aminotransferase